MPRQNIRTTVTASESETVLTVATLFVRIGVERPVKDARAGFGVLMPGQSLRSSKSRDT
jgi:hypothetical protein